MEETWERKRKAIERQHREKAEDDTVPHVSRVTHQMDKAQQEREKLQWDTNQAIQNQKANHAKQMEELNPNWFMDPEQAWLGNQYKNTHITLRKTTRRERIQ